MTLFGFGRMEERDREREKTAERKFQNGKNGVK